MDQLSPVAAGSIRGADAGPVLETRDVRRSFGGFTAVDGVSLQVRRGEVVGIAGPNGAGKSTLFNLVSGVPFGPTSGEVLFAGRRIDGMSPSRISRLGLRRTFQSEQLFPSLTVLHNVSVAAAYLGRERGSGGRLARSRALAALETVGLREHADARAADVPLLAKKKLMIASALVGGAELLMLDEPAGGLNREDQDELVALLRRLQEGGLTLLVIEHVLSLLRQLAGRMVVLASGRVLAEGTPAEVLRDPRVVEAYLGQSQA